MATGGKGGSLHKWKEREILCRWEKETWKALGKEMLNWTGEGKCEDFKVGRS